MDECYCYFTNSNTHPWVFSRSHKWYQITQSITYIKMISRFKVDVTYIFQDKGRDNRGKLHNGGEVQLNPMQ